MLDGKYTNPYTIKMFGSLKRKIPVICLVRDPISILKSCVNLSISDHIRSSIIDKNKNLPSVIAIELLNNFIYSPEQQLRFTSSLQQVQHIAKESIFFDTADISGHDNTIRTLQRITEVLQMEDVKYEDLFDKDVTFNDFIKRSFPRTETIHTGGKYLKIIFGFEESFYRYFDGSKFALPHPVLFENISSDFFPDKNFKILLDKRFVLESAVKKLREDLGTKMAVSNAIEQYCARLLEAEQYHKESILHEKDILKLLKENPESSKKLRDLLEYEVSEVARLAPHIVEKWQYYKIFLNDKS